LDAAAGRIHASYTRIGEIAETVASGVMGVYNRLTHGAAVAADATVELEGETTELGVSVVATGNAYETGLTPALVAAGGAASDATEKLDLLTLAGIRAAISAARTGQSLARTANERLDFQQQIEELTKLEEAMIRAFTLVDIPVPEFQIIIRGVNDVAGTLRAQTAEYLANAAAARQAAVDAAGFNAAGLVGSGQARELQTAADRLRGLTAAYLENAKAARQAAVDAVAFSDAGLLASSSAADFTEHAQMLADAANAMEVGLAGANAELVLTPAEAMAAADSLLKFTQAQRRLGRATEDDVNRALVNQAEALKNLMASLSPTDDAWASAANRLADIYDGLQTNEAALVAQMGEVEANTEKWTALEEQLQRVRSVMALLGLTTGGPTPGDAVDNAVKQGVEALRGYLNQAGESIGTFGNFALDVALKLPLVGSALQGLTVEFDKAGNLISTSFDPMKALTSIFLELIGKSESFRNLVQAINDTLAPLVERIIGPLADVMLKLLEAVSPLIEILVNLIELALKPFLFIFTNVLAPILLAIANAIRAVWNALARVIPGMKRIPEPTQSGGGAGESKSERPRVTYVDESEVRFENVRDERTIIGLEDRIQALRDMERIAVTQSQRDAVRGHIDFYQSALSTARGQEPRTVDTPTPDVETDDERTATVRSPSEVNFGAMSQSLQFGIATPLLDASENMLDAAMMMKEAFSGMLPSAPNLGDVMLPFTNVLARMTPVLEELLENGVSINLNQAAATGTGTGRTSFLRGLV
jgi:hypothetical protein